MKIPVSFRCYYPSGKPCCKVQEIALADIPKWIEAYLFTHPNCTAITVKVWTHNLSE